MSTETETESTIEEAPPELAYSERGDPSRTHIAEHIVSFRHHLVSAAREPGDVLKFQYWSRHSQLLMRGDFVLCEDAAMSWAVLLRVLEVSGEGAVVESWGGKETLQYAPPPPKRGPLGTNDDDFSIVRSEEFVDKFAVVRKHDNFAMTGGQPFSREQCANWLKTYLATARKT